MIKALTRLRKSEIYFLIKKLALKRTNNTAGESVCNLFRVTCSREPMKTAHARPLVGNRGIITGTRIEVYRCHVHVERTTRSVCPFQLKSGYRTVGCPHLG